MNILLITHSRVAGVMRLIESVLKSDSTAQIYISIDGYKSEKVKQSQIEMKKYFDDYVSNGVAIKYRFLEINYGVGPGVLNAIDWFFSEVKDGIILEDDLLVSDDFFTYCNQMLEVFKSDDQVWMISGSQLLGSMTSPSELNFTNYPMIWGWATWRQKWIEMRKFVIENKPIRFSKLLDRRYLYWAIGANRALNGLVDTWDTPLAFEFLTRGKICVIPPMNLVSNVGDDSSAAHTAGSGFPLHVPIGFYEGVKRFHFENRDSKIRVYNSRLESELFRIRFHHLLIPYYSRVVDRFKFPKEKRNIKLVDRLN